MEEANIPVDEEIKIEMTKDYMLGVICFVEPKNGGRILSAAEVLQAIEQKGIISGVDQESIKEVVKHKKYFYKYVIAKGVPARDGTDAKVDLCFDAERLGKMLPKENGDGTVDFKELDSVRSVSKGEVLAKKTPATEGVDGVNILGKVLKAKRGKDCRLPVGKNTKLSENGLALVAAEEGKLEYDGVTVSVSTVCTIEGDVDNSTGNIDFIGSVIVNGSVHDGFTVKAKGSIEVRGPVEGATLIAGSDIILSYGIQGSLESSLTAGGNIVAKFIQNAHVEAEGNIIAEGIWNSTVNAGGIVKVDIGKGSIMGGNIMATNFVLARNVGSPMGILTDIHTGIQPCVFTEYAQLGDIICKEQEELNKIEKEIIYIKTRNMADLENKFVKARLERLMISRQAQFELLNEKKKRYRNLSTRMENVTDGIVKVSGTIYPGTRLIFGNLSKEITYEERNCSIRKVGQDIYIGGYGDIPIDSLQPIGEQTVDQVEDGLRIKEIGTYRYQKK